MVDIFGPNFMGYPTTGGVSSGGSTRVDTSTQSVGVREMQKELGRHRLIIEVLVRALIEKGLYTRDQLNALANLVDMEDGIRDGRIKPKKGVKHCAECSRVLMDVSGQCMYCGHQTVMDIV